jgi:predicted Rossmann fold nucleotide-binding protein DprA/Smf involved in DNA uptake
MSVIDDALRALRARLSELEREAGHLRAAIAAIENSAPPDAPVARLATGSNAETKAAPAARRGRTPRGQNRKRILKQIKTEAKTASEIAHETGIKTAIVQSTLTKLLNTGQATKETRGYKAARKTTPARR